MLILLGIIHVLVCAFLIVAVLLQSGKGGGLASSIGGGMNSAVFGGRAAANFLTRATTVLAASFLLLCLVQSFAYRRTEELPTSATEKMVQQGNMPLNPVPLSETLGKAPAEAPAEAPAGKGGE